MASKYTSISVFQKDAVKLKELAAENGDSSPAKELEKLLASIDDGQYLMVVKDEATLDSVKRCITVLKEKKISFTSEEGFLKYLCDQIAGEKPAETKTPEKKDEKKKDEKKK